MWHELFLNFEKLRVTSIERQCVLLNCNRFFHKITKYDRVNKMEMVLFPFLKTENALKVSFRSCTSIACAAVPGMRGMRRGDWPRPIP